MFTGKFVSFVPSLKIVPRWSLALCVSLILGFANTFASPCPPEEDEDPPADDGPGEEEVFVLEEQPAAQANEVTALPHAE